MWVLYYLDDIRSDMSVFHRIDDIDKMPALKFFAYADRLVAYSGAVQMRMNAEAVQERQRLNGNPVSSPHGTPGRNSENVVNLETAMALPGARGDLDEGGRFPPIFNHRTAG
jgi:hypothetical protein